MIQKHIDSIEKADIDALITDGVLESKSLEYKQELPANSDKHKKEFLADVSSFGNATGGDIIYGIKAATDIDGKKTGGPENVLPISGVTADEAKLRLEEMVRNGIDPRLPIYIRAIAGYGSDGQGFVILVRVPKSFASPHVVTYKGAFTFYSRNSAGKYPLDVQELRSAFLATDSQVQRVKRFRESRLGQIVVDDTPVQLSTPHRLVLHVIPLTSFLNDERLNISSLDYSKTPFYPLDGYGHRRFNLDGLVTHSTDTEDGPKNKSYCQLFFNGVIESVDADMIRAAQGARAANGIGGIASVAYEQDVIQAVTSYLSGYKQLQIAPPVAISMAILGCKGSFLHVNQMLMARHGVMAIDRDTAILPDIVVDSLDVDIPAVMKPVFDAVWNACGYPRSFNYDELGNWKPQR
jgi:hypothetical protein